MQHRNFAVALLLLLSPSVVLRTNAATAAEYGVILGPLGNAPFVDDHNVVASLAASNMACPCPTQVGCVPKTQNKGVSTIDALLRVDETVINATKQLEESSDYFAYFTRAMFSAVTNFATQTTPILESTIDASGTHTGRATCVDLLDSSSSTTGCPADKVAFGTAECGACIGAGMWWCPSAVNSAFGKYTVLPPVCMQPNTVINYMKFTDPSTGSVVTYNPSLATLQIDPRMWTVAITDYETTNNFTMGLNPYTQWMAYNYTQTLVCPFSNVAPVKLAANCPVEKICPNCNTAPTLNRCTCAGDSPNCCTHGVGHWAIPTDAWPTCGNVAETTVIFPDTTMKQVLVTPSKGNRCISLAKHWVIARLNVCGPKACTNSAINQALTAAENLLLSSGKCPNGLTEKADQKIATEIMNVLVAFNEGIAGPGQCSDIVIDTAAAAVAASSSSSGVSVDKVYGIAISGLVIALVALILGAVAFLCKQRRSRRQGHV